MLCECRMPGLLSCPQTPAKQIGIWGQVDIRNGVFHLSLLSSCLWVPTAPCSAVVTSRDGRGGQPCLGDLEISVLAGWKCRRRSSSSKAAKVARTGKVAEIKWAVLGFSYYGFLFLEVTYKHGDSCLWSPSPTALKKSLWKKLWSRDAHSPGLHWAGGQQVMKGTWCFLLDRLSSVQQKCNKACEWVGDYSSICACAKDSAKLVTTLLKSRKWSWVPDLIISPPPHFPCFCASIFAECPWVKL